MFFSLIFGISFLFPFNVESLLCQYCKGDSRRAFQKIYVTTGSQNSECPNFAPPDTIECSSEYRCVAEATQDKFNKKWTVVKGCKKPYFNHESHSENSCWFRETKRHTEYRCNCDFDQCNKGTVEDIKVKNEIIIIYNIIYEVFYCYTVIVLR